MAANTEALAKIEPPTPITQRQEELFELRQFYAGEEWKNQDLLFLSQALMYACFPYRQTKNKTFTRVIKTKQGTIKISLKAMDDDIALPFGKDRVLLGCALTKARQKSRPEITFQELEPLLKLFGEDYRRYGGSDYERFKDRWHRLKNCAIMIERNGLTTEGDNKFIIAKYRLPKRKRGPRTRGRQLTIAAEEPVYAVQFGADFWKDFLAYCVPMPVPLMRKFAEQPKAWDICTLTHWASYSAIRSKKSGGQGIKRITLQDLIDVLGSVDKNPRRLKKTIHEVLIEMRTVWPELNAHFEPNGDLLIGVPTNEKLLVQPGEYAEEVRDTVERSFRRGIAGKVGETW